MTSGYFSSCKSGLRSMLYNNHYRSWKNGTLALTDVKLPIEKSTAVNLLVTHVTTSGLVVPFSTIDAIVQTKLRVNSRLANVTLAVQMSCSTEKIDTAEIRCRFLTPRPVCPEPQTDWVTKPVVIVSAVYKIDVGQNRYRRNTSIFIMCIHERYSRNRRRLFTIAGFS